MDVYYAYTYGTAAWLSVQAIPLITSPTIIVAFLSPEVREASSLEVYFSRSLGFTLLALAALNIILTGSIPLSASLRQEGGVSTDPSDPKAPFALPTLMFTMVYHGAMAFYSWAMWTETGVTTFSFGTTVSSLLAAIGLWTVLFGSTSGRISRKTGADKRTSGFPFKNAEADKRNGGKRM